MRLLQRLRQDFDALVAVIFALVGQLVVAPGLEHDIDRLVEAWGALFTGDAKGFEFAALKTASSTPIDASTRQHVEQGHFLSKPQRVVKGCKRDARTDAKALRSGCCHYAHHVYGRAHGKGRKVVLGEPDHVVARLVHDDDALERHGIDRGKRYRAILPTEELQHADFHAPPSRSHS